MNEEELRLFGECEDVLNYINELTGLKLALWQVSADIKDIKLLNGERVLFRDNLANLRKITAGMLVMTELKEAPCET